jgi:hypothetical protein
MPRLSRYGRRPTLTNTTSKYVQNVSAEQAQDQTCLHLRGDAALLELDLDGAVGLLDGAGHLGLQLEVHALRLEDRLELLRHIKIDACRAIKT